MSDKVVYVNKDNFNEVMSKDGVILIDFFAEWCGPCKMLAPVIDKLSEEYDGKATICKCNIDENEELANMFKVATIPTLYFVKNQKAFNKIIGLVNPMEIKKIIDKNI